MLTYIVSIIHMVGISAYFISEQNILRIIDMKENIYAINAVTAQRFYFISIKPNNTREVGSTPHPYKQLEKQFRLTPAEQVGIFLSLVSRTRSSHNPKTKMRVRTWEGKSFLNSKKQPFLYLT